MTTPEFDLLQRAIERFTEALTLVNEKHHLREPNPLLTFHERVLHRAKVEALRSSAASKLTDAERKAVGL